MSQGSHTIQALFTTLIHFSCSSATSKALTQLSNLSFSFYVDDLDFSKQFVTFDRRQAEPVQAAAILVDPD